MFPTEALAVRFGKGPKLRQESSEDLNTANRNADENDGW